MSRLQAAALEVFAERGFHGASIEEICTRAGLSRGAFYSNFEDKEALFFALFDEHADREVARLDAAISDASTVEEALDGLTGDGSGDEERLWFLASTEFTLHAIRNPQTAERLAEHDRRLRARLTELLTGFFARVGRHGNLDLDPLARLLIALHEGALMQSLIEPDRLPPGELQRRFLPAILRAEDY
ncbi:TetR/AcrR family transcriptional regulator [Streptomyces sp. NPDC056656]|uniref:TetR/AcrR family transcriptional regulator n=1 Tax=unclassified Streptomyces TaxID=2593676 RepID=UPI001F222FE3|nr:TetR/AcrR family transcriptional regulator [Streptomyces sp. CB01635]